MSKVIQLPIESCVLKEDTTVDVDEAKIQALAMRAFEEAVENNCGLRDCVLAVFLAGVEHITGAKPVKRKATAVPPCRYTEIVDLYHDALPMLPGVQLLDADRRKNIRKFWVWIFESRKADGSKRATDTASALLWVGLYFARAADNAFINGKTPRTAAHKNWKPDIDYVVSPRGMKQVFERTEDAS